MRFLLLVVTVCLCSCVSPGSFLSRAKAIISTPSSKIEQSGNVATPAQSTVTTTKTEVPIPAGSTVTITTPPAKPDDKPVVLSSSSTTEHVVAPSSFQPPPPPTPAQLAEGQTKLWFWLGVMVGVCAAIFGLVRDWNLVMYGGIAVAGACLFAIFVQNSPWVIAIIAAGVALKVAGPLIWHTQIKSNLPPDVPPTVSK